MSLTIPTATGNGASVPASSSPLLGLAANGGNSKAADVQRTVQIFPPWQYPIPSARAFYARSYGNVIAAEASDVVIANCSFQTATGQDACIRSIVALVLSPTTAMNLFFSVKLNGVVLPGWDQLTVPPVNASAIEQPFMGSDDVIRVQQSTTITVTATNTSAAAFTVGMAFNGWFWPSVDATRLMGGLDY